MELRFFRMPDGTDSDTATASDTDSETTSSDSSSNTTDDTASGDSSTSSGTDTSAGSTQNKIQFDVQGTIDVLAQPKSMACWATVTTMLMEFHQSQCFTIETAMDSLGSDFRKLFDDNTGLAADRVQDLATATGMTIEYQRCETPESILQLLQNYGLISIVDNEGSNTNWAVHNRIIKGIYGDGTGANTFLKIVDPDGGRTYDESFDTFASKYEGMSEANEWTLQMLHY